MGIAVPTWRGVVGGASYRTLCGSLASGRPFRPGHRPRCIEPPATRLTEKKRWNLTAPIRRYFLIGHGRIPWTPSWKRTPLRDRWPPAVLAILIQGSVFLKLAGQTPTVDSSACKGALWK